MKRTLFQADVKNNFTVCGCPIRGQFHVQPVFAEAFLDSKQITKAHPENDGEALREVK